jgi:hypothetical protein
MATAMYTETFEQLQRTTPLNSENGSYILDADIRRLWTRMGVLMLSYFLSGSLNATLPTKIRNAFLISQI